MEPDNLALDRYALAQVDKTHPKVCFIPTASGESQEYILNFYKAFVALDCEPSYLSLFRLPTADLEGYLLEKDLIYVGGGNTRSMLALWQEWEIDLILRKAHTAGILLAGVSAGANCWFQECSTDSVPGELRMLRCLGLVPGSFCPHYDGEAQRRGLRLIIEYAVFERTHVTRDMARDKRRHHGFDEGTVHGNLLEEEQGIPRPQGRGPLWVA